MVQEGNLIWLSPWKMRLRLQFVLSGRNKLLEAGGGRGKAVLH